MVDAADTLLLAFVVEFDVPLAAVALVAFVVLLVVFAVALDEFPLKVPFDPAGAPVALALELLVLLVLLVLFVLFVSLVVLALLVRFDVVAFDVPFEAFDVVFDVLLVVEFVVVFDVAFEALVVVVVWLVVLELLELLDALSEALEELPEALEELLSSPRRYRPLTSPIRSAPKPASSSIAERPLEALAKWTALSPLIA